MIDHIIKIYLQKNKRLVVPEFGAFIRKDGGEIVFVEFLKKDDQVLTSLLRNEYGLSDNEAHDAVNDYVLGIKRAVGTTGKYVIDGIGSIITDANGLYALHYDPLVRKEPEQIQPSVAEQAPEPTREPKMKVVSLREEEEHTEEVPQVSNDIILEPRRERVAKEVATPEVKQDNTIEFRYREVPPEPQPIPEKKAFTLNDLYSVPASGPSKKAEPEAQPRAFTSARPQGSPVSQAPRPQVRQQAPRQRPVNYRAGNGKSKMDIVMIVAVVAALIAIGSLVYGLLVKNDPVIKPTKPQTEQTEGVTDGQESVEELLEGEPTADQ